MNEDIREMIAEDTGEDLHTYHDTRIPPKESLKFLLHHDPLEKLDKLSTIQKHHNLNQIYRHDIGVGGAAHVYSVKCGCYRSDIIFQDGPRSEPESTHGVLDVDLLEIVRDRLSSFQNGPFACRENAIALSNIEGALLWMNHRVEERAERGVLGTTNK